jgi:hypothetical protein
VLGSSAETENTKRKKQTSSQAAERADVLVRLEAGKVRAHAERGVIGFGERGSKTD